MKSEIYGKWVNYFVIVVAYSLFNASISKVETKRPLLCILYI